MANTKPNKSGKLSGNADYVLLGELGRAQGLKGEIRLKSFTANPQAIADYNPVFLETGEQKNITVLRQAAGDQTDMLVIRVEGVDDRNGAEALNRVGLYVERTRLPETEDEDEFLHADLIGLKVFDASGTGIGTVSAISNYGGGDILEVAPVGLLVPFTKDFVPEIDIKQGRVTIDYAETEDEDEEPSL
ncbi:ribosome maturation factor RimM [Microvirga sp. W0021]|uniref:Ribosome maturation factor RimM n=1 Tax=Hohaiivirga grylli TaxID=3133970 RepID=A0ABV0BEY9_9HYPH